MKNALLLLSVVLCLAGCSNSNSQTEISIDAKNEVQTSEVKKVWNKETHVKRIWKQDRFELDEIDGHMYIVGRIIGIGYGSDGVCSIVHSPECPCQKAK